MIDVTLPWPPSVNTYWRHPTSGKLAGRHLVSKVGRQYRQAVSTLAIEQQWMRGQERSADTRLSVQIDAYPPDRRARDIDNVLKAALDSLQNAGLIHDDSLVDHLSIRRMPTIAGMLKVRIAEML